MVTSYEAEAQAEMAQRQFGPDDTLGFSATPEERKLRALQQVREEFKGLKPEPFQMFKYTYDHPSSIIRDLPESAREAAKNGSCIVRQGLNVDLLANGRKTMKEREAFLQELEALYSITRNQVAICACQRLVGDTIQEIWWVDINFL